MSRSNELEATIERSRAELSALQNGTWDALLLYRWHDGHEGITPSELAEVLDLAPSTANERLRKLWRAGLVTREWELVEGGGRSFRYRIDDRKILVN